ncbi:MAG: DUF4332 domain-containing protein [Candidatus Heimdallarchaeota archaeon]|nr:MAG: DUF4332 domain-containing protein [Candidatus Heimdallarchaeota archaeon]
MDEDDFRAFLKQKKKPENTINSYINRTKTFEEFLSSRSPPKGLNDATREDIEEFVLEWGKEQGINVYLYLWGIQFYYLYTKDLNLYNTANEMKEWVQLEKYKLKDFEGVNEEYIKILGSIGIKTAQQLLGKGRTPTERKELTKESGIPVDYILELVKLSNLARIGGLKKKRARLFYDAGFDTLDKITAKDTNELINEIETFIEKTGFKGRGVSTSEAKYTISTAKFLQRIIEY